MSLHKRKRAELLKLYDSYLLSKVSKVRILSEAEPRELKSVFVELTIADRRRHYEDSQFVGMMEDTFRGQLRGSSELPQHVGTKRSVRPDQLVPQNTKGIVTGSPGCGKTTLLKYVALQARQDNRLVVWLELKTITELLLTQAEKVATDKGHFLLQELWARHLKTQLSLSEAELEVFRAFWLEALKTNQLVVLLDGFDELQEGGVQDRLNKCISEFVSSFRDNTILISTRSYATRRLGHERLEELEIEPLNHHQIEAFLTCYHPNDAAVAGLLRKLREPSTFGELLRAPLLLGVVLHLYRECKFTVESLELYQAIITILVHELDRSKSVRRQFRIPDERLRLSFLRFLAFEQLLRSDAETEGQQASRVLFSYDLLKQKAAAFLLLERYSYAPRDLIEDVLATPLLSEIGPETFAFTHLTLQEYLAACEFAVFHQRDEFEGLRIFCQAYFDQKIVEMEVLPMMLAASSKTNSLYKELECLPEPFTFANFRLRARGLVYGAKIDHERLRKMKESLVSFLWEYRVESKPYLDVIASSLTHSPQCYLTPIAEELGQFLSQNQFDYTRAKTTDLLGRMGGEKARSLLESVLKDKAQYIRQKAAYWLGELRDKRSAPAVMEALSDQDDDVANAAARALVNVSLQESVEAFIKSLQTGNTASRSTGIYWLGIIGREKSLDIIEGILVNEEGEVRLKALEALGFIGGERALSMLCNFKICATTVTAVGQCGGEKAISFLLSALENPLVYVRCAALDALAKIDAKRFTDVFVGRLRDSDSYVRQRAAMALDRAGDRRAIPALLAALDYNSHLDLISSHRGDIVGAAAHALRHFRDEEVFQSLLALLQKHKGGHGTESAALALGRIGDTRAVGPLLEVFENARNIAWAAAEALGLIGDKRATVRLVSALGEGDSMVQMRAAEALGRIKDERAVVPLVAILQDQLASEEAALALRNFDGAILARELPKALTHENPFVRRKAVTYIPYYAVDSSLVVEMSQLAESDADDFVRLADREAKTLLIRKLEILTSIYDAKVDELATDNESKEGVSFGEVQTIVSSAGHIYRRIPPPDWGLDVEIEFKNERNEASGQRAYLQLKSGDSYLYQRKGDGKHIFTIKKPRHAEYWLSQAYPVLLLIRKSDGQILWMNVTEYLRSVGPSVTKIEFQGEPFTAERVKRMRTDFAPTPFVNNGIRQEIETS